MTVKIKKGIFKIKFWLPTRMAAVVLMRAMKGEAVKRGFTTCYKRQQKRQIKKTVLKIKKDFGKLEVLSVSISEGFEICIIL